MDVCGQFKSYMSVQANPTPALALTLTLTLSPSLWQARGWAYGSQAARQAAKQATKQAGAIAWLRSVFWWWSSKNTPGGRKASLDSVTKFVAYPSRI